MKSLILLILLIIIPFFSFAAESDKSMWEEEVKIFRQTSLCDLEKYRGSPRPNKFLLRSAVDILSFIERSSTKHGLEALLGNENIIFLMSDMLYVIHEQDTDFKNRYDFLFQQLGPGGKVIPFSIHSFDRVALLFQPNGSPFDTSLGSNYHRLIEIIFTEEIPTLLVTLKRILDLEFARGSISIEETPYGLEYYDGRYLDHLRITNEKIDLAKLSPKVKRNKIEAGLRKIIPVSHLPNLAQLTNMTQDLVSLIQILSIDELFEVLRSVSTKIQRNSLLYLYIMIGEKSSNKKISTWMQRKRNKIPWKKLLDIRDLIIHQDEHGLEGFFEAEIESPSKIDFYNLKLNLKTFIEEAAALLIDVWGTDPKKTFEDWIGSILSGDPIYGVSLKSPEAEKVRWGAGVTKKVWRKSPLFSSNKDHWCKILAGTKKVSFETISTLIEATNELKTLLLDDTLAERDLLEKQLASYEKVREYIIERLTKETSKILDFEDREYIIALILANLDKEDLVKSCLDLLYENPGIFNKDNEGSFKSSFTDNGIDYARVEGMSKLLSPKMISAVELHKNIIDAISTPMSQEERLEFHRKMEEQRQWYSGASLPVVFDLRRRMDSYRHFIPHLYTLYLRAQTNRFIIPAYQRFLGSFSEALTPGLHPDLGSIEDEWNLAQRLLSSIGIKVDKLSTDHIHFKKFEEQMMASAREQATSFNPYQLPLYSFVFSQRYYGIIAGAALQSWVDLHPSSAPSKISNIQQVLIKYRIMAAHGNTFYEGIHDDPEDFSGRVTEEHRVSPLEMGTGIVAMAIRTANFHDKKRISEPTDLGSWMKFLNGVITSDRFVKS